MNNMKGFTSDYISKAVDEVRQIKPDYAPMLDLYEKVFIKQENSVPSIHLKNFKISDEALSLKWKEKFPLMEISQFVLDQGVSEALFKEICQILASQDNELSQAVVRLIDMVDTQELKLDELFAAFIREDESFFDRIEDELDVSKEILGFISYNSVKPSLSVYSRMASEYLDKEHAWDKGYCPICGSKPEISIFGDNGQRSFICSFCTHQWQSKRIYCPFCENTDHDTLHYFSIENEEEYRVDVCDKCNRYIKTIDTKKISRSIYLPLENLSTPYINVKFEGMGFKSGNAGLVK